MGGLFELRCQEIRVAHKTSLFLLMAMMTGVRKRGGSIIEKAVGNLALES